MIHSWYLSFKCFFLGRIDIPPCCPIIFTKGDNFVIFLFDCLVVLVIHKNGPTFKGKNLPV